MPRRFAIGVAAGLLVAASGVEAEEGKLPVPWPTSSGEVIPYDAPAAKKAPATKAPAVTKPPPSEPEADPTPAAATPAAGTPAPVPAATATTAATEPAPGPTGAAPQRHTHLGALGDGVLFFDRDGNADADLRRLLARLTHAPAPWVRFVAEAGLENTTAFGAQQAVIELAPVPAFGVRAGLLLLPLGIINQMNAPTTYLTVDRPLTDQLIIPTFWRELGAGIYGELARVFRYELDVVGGLDGAGFAAQGPLAGGRGNGHHIGFRGVAVAGRLELGGLPPGFAIGGSGYYGSASGGQAALDGVSVGIVEGDVRYRGGGLDLRAEYAQVFILNSYLVNDYLGLLGQDAIPKIGRGGYVQAGYDLLRLGGPDIRQELVLFAAYENVNPRHAMSPYNFNPPAITPPGELAPNDPSPARSFVRGGIVYRPMPELAFKVDLQIALDGEAPAAVAPMTLPGAPGTPRPLDPQLAAAARGQTRLGLGVGFAF